MKINYGIYIGSSSASIAKIEAGNICVLKSNGLDDEIPLCIAFNKKGVLVVGKMAYSVYRTEQITSLSKDVQPNAFIEFNRTMGTDKKYFSSNANRSFSSEELLSEVIKCLIFFEKSTNIKVAVLTIPNSYKLNQKEALRKSAKLAGLKQVEFIQESVAAGLNYNLDSIRNIGFNLVFHFEDEFKVCLLKGNSFLDTEGDNYLGGKNLDLAIVDEIILPYIKENYAIDSILEDDNKKQILRNAIKFYAEETKIKLSFNETYNILSDLGDIPGEDDNGEEFELDITVTQADMERALSPIFQKAVDICKKLLERNNLKPSTINKLVLVGKETYSPLLQKC